MNKSSSILFFIIISATIATPEEDIANINNGINPVLKELTDLSISTKSAVEMCTEKINTLLSIDLAATEFTNADLMTEYLSLARSLPQIEVRPIKMDSEKLQITANAILDSMFPSIETLDSRYAIKREVTGAPVEVSPEQATELKAVFFANAEESVNKLFESMQLALSNELIDGLLRVPTPQERTEGRVFKFTSRNELVKSFNSHMIKIASEFSRAYSIKVKNEANAIVEIIQNKNNEYVNQFLKNTQQLTLLLNAPIRTLKYFVIKILNQAVIDNRVHQPEVQERLEFIISLIARLSALDSSNDTNADSDAHFKDLLSYIGNYCKQNAEDPRIAHDSALPGLMNRYTAQILQGMNTYMDRSTLLQTLSFVFANEEGLHFDSERVSDVVTHAFTTIAFPTECSPQTAADISTKVRLIDYITYVKAESFSEERFDFIIANIEKLINLPVDYRKLAFLLKSLINVKLMNVSQNQKFYTDLYLLINDFLASLNNPDLNQEIYENFDLYINQVFEEHSNRFVTANYLILKIVNLIFTKSTSNYMTEFLEFNPDSETVAQAAFMISENSLLFQKFEFYYKKLMFQAGKSSRHLQSTPDLSIFSGLSVNANMFSSVKRNIEVNQEKVKNEIGNHKIQIDMVKDEGFQRNKPSILSKVQKVSTSDTESISKGLHNIPEAFDETEIPVIDELEPILKKQKTDLKPSLLGSIIESADEEDSNSDEEKDELVRNAEEDQYNRVDRNPELNFVNQVIKKVERQNLVNEIIGRLPAEDILSLKTGSLDDYINSHDIVTTKDNVETTYTFIKVVRKNSPCHPNRKN